MHEYGKANWEKLWEQLEQQGNVGIDYVINPYLYPRLVSLLADRPKSLAADFGCGTNLMGIQLLFGYAPSIPAFEGLQNVDQARFNTLLYVGIEGSQTLVDQANRYLSDVGNPRNIGTVQMHIGKDLEKLFDDNTLDVCTSRNFLMHLSLEDLKVHMQYVADALKPGGSYVFATLNPEYELLKAGRPLAEGERYEFSHGAHGEYGTFYHYYKSREFYESTIQKRFTIEETVSCVPKTDRFQNSHERYYDSNIPMAYVYSLKVKK
ncbi:MAG: class I SAM-dependent methyltransferase [Candidatus Pacebacteria bacterium]|nr:class I SAM-dependent methyltransferase [Candidatus Paceibacterota bacterium]